MTVLITLLVICLIALSFYFGYKLGLKNKPTQKLDKESIKYMNQFMNVMNYTCRGSK